MALPTYSTGTASVAAGGTVVTGVGCSWTGINAKQGDFISIGGSDAALITEVTDATHLKVAPWTAGAKTTQPYILYQNYVGRVVGVAAAEDVGDMLEHLKGQGPIYNVPPTDTVPDPSYGSDGQYAYKPTTGTWWIKTGGVWTTTAPPGGVYLSDAPSDGAIYGRQSAAWAKAVKLAGDTMTGALRVSVGGVKVGDAGGSTDKLSVVSSAASDASLGLYQGGLGQWSWGMVSGSGTMRLRNGGLAGTDRLLIDTNGVTSLGGPGAPQFVSYGTLLSIRTAAGAFCFEWGHSNVNGYGSQLGCNFINGNPWILFNGSRGTTGNKFKTWGLKGSIIISDNLGGLQFGQIANAGVAGVGVDDQDITPLATLSPAGELTWTGAAWTAYTPTVTVGTGTVVATGRYKKHGTVLVIQIKLTFNTAVTGTIVVGLPIASTQGFALMAKEVAVNGFDGGLYAIGATGAGSILKSDASSFTANGSVILISGTYEVA